MNLLIQLTPTKLKDYLTCPQMYYLKHVRRRVRFADSAAAAFGRSVHAVLEEFHNPIGSCSGVAGSSIDVEVLLKRHWQNAYTDQQESESYFALAHRSLKRYVDEFAAKPDETLGCEVFMARVFNAAGQRVGLGCKADRVSVRADGTLVVTDYKTHSSGKVPTPESLRADLPTFIYYLLSRVSYPEYECCTVRFLNVLSLVHVEVRYDAETVATNKVRLREVFRRIADTEFTARACEACAWCEAQPHCPLYNVEVALDSIA